MKPTSVRAFSPNWTITVGLGLLQQIRAFGLIHSARVAVPDERVRRAAERHADVLGRIAGASHMLHLVAAVADAHAHVLGRPDDLAGPLVVQHPQPAVGGRRFRIDLRRCRRERGAPLALRQRRLVDEHAPELRLAAGEQVQDEVVLNRDVLVEELAQQLLVDVVADVHHRELEEAGHRGWERIDDAARTLHVEQDRPRGQRIQDDMRLRLAHPPDLRRLLRAERPDRQLRHEPGFALAEQHLEDAVEQLRRWGALWEPVEPVGQPLIRTPGCRVGHGEVLRPRATTWAARR
jgi:hypothetical protein